METNHIILSKNSLHQLQEVVPALIYSTRVTPEGLILRTTPSKLRALAHFLHSDAALQFETLVDIAVIDKMLSVARFHVNYVFLSTRLGQRITVQLYANETTTIPSLSAPFVNGQRIFAAAD